MKNSISLAALALLFFGCKQTEMADIPKAQDTTQTVHPTVPAITVAKGTYYLDALKGDNKGNGSQAHPFKTLDRVMDTLQSGDVVLLNNGNYGNIVAGRTPGVNFGFSQSEITIPKSKFTSWVTIKAAPGQTPHINRLDLGTLNIPNSGSPAQTIPFSQKGNSDLYMRFEGLTIDDGVVIFGSRYVDVKNCIINRIGELNGSVNNMDNKYGVEVRNGRYITIEGNEITHVAIGVGGASYDFVIKNNHIHHNSHDGIRVYGGENWLIEGNRIHDLDDGINDIDNAFDAGANASWNRHVDGIQIFELYGPTNQLVVRGNLFYHLESMGVMVNEGTVHYSDWLFEDNIFGPVGGVVFLLGADIYNSMIFRQNTIVYAPNDVWKSMYGRTMNGQVYSLNLWDVAAVNGGYQFYNNILTKVSPIPTVYAVASNNLFCDNTTGYPYESIPGNIQDYIDKGKLPGALKSGSLAINAGTAKYYTGGAVVDFNGKQRDNKPDIGAFEN